jgi:isopentenyl-diphosphate delta-isomerase
MDSDDRSELLETMDDEGHPLGLQPRRLVHSRGLWHRSVNVIVFRSTGQMLMQRRSRFKDVCPGRWDLSVAEHLQPGETFVDAAYRGLKEELSLRIAELVPVEHELRQRLKLTEQGILDFELQRLFVGVADEDPVVSDREVDAVRYATLQEVAMIRARSPEALTPWFASWLDAVTENELLPESVLAKKHAPTGSLDS